MKKESFSDHAAGKVAEIGFRQQRIVTSAVVSFLAMGLSVGVSPHFIWLSIFAVWIWGGGTRDLALYRANYLNGGALDARTQNLYIAFWANSGLPMSIVGVDLLLGIAVYAEWLK